MSPKKILSIILVVSSVVCEAAYPSLDARIEKPTETNLSKDVIYDVTSANMVEVLGAFDDDMNPISSFENLVSLDPSHTFEVLRVDTQKGTAIIDLGEDEYGEGTPLAANIYEVRLTDLYRLRPIELDLATILNPSLDGDQILNDMVSTMTAARGRAQGPRHRRRSTGTWCKRDVRLITGVASKSWCAGDGYNLEYASWTAVGRNWETAAPGTVCFFRRGRRTPHCPHGAGHMAIKLPSGMWKGAGVRAYPYPNRNWQDSYDFQGCKVRL